MDDSQTVEVNLDIQDPESLPDSVRDALQKLSAAMAEEEIGVTDELRAALEESDEVGGFQFGKTIPIGRIPMGPTTMGPTVQSWCIFKSSGGSGGDSCGVYSRDEGDMPTDSCGVYVFG